MRRRQFIWFLPFLSHVITSNIFFEEKHTPSHNIHRLYFHVTVSMIMHVWRRAFPVPHVFSCTPVFKHESVPHVIVMTCVCVYQLLARAFAHKGQEIRCIFTQGFYVSFIPSIYKEKLRTGKEMVYLSVWLICGEGGLLWRQGDMKHSHIHTDTQECMTVTMGIY